MRYADLVLKSSAVFDGVNDVPFDGAVAVSEGKIVYCGNKEGVQDYIGNLTVVKDFGDCLITPGLCDGHAHINGTIFRECAPAAHIDNCTSMKECLDVACEFYKQHPEVEFVYGTGWMLNYWEEGAPFPTKEDIDAVLPDIPVYLQSGDGHTFWLNSKAIEVSGILDFKAKNDSWLSPDWLVKDSDGKMTGLFKEGYVGYLMDITQRVSPAMMTSFRKDLVRIMNSYGLTGMSEMTMFDPSVLPENLADFKMMEKAGTLSARFYLFVDPFRNPRGIQSVIDMVPFFDTDQIKIVGIKECMDGIPAMHTAAMIEPYYDDPSTTGVFAKDKEVIMNEIVTANKYGFPVRTHCTGDNAVRYALDCYEESLKQNGRKGLRNTIEHMDGVSDADLPRFKALDVTPSMQPAHLIMDNRIRVQRLGPEVSKYDWAFRRLADAGMTEHLVVGTDSPVVSINPYHNIYMAITRKNLQGECLSREGAGNQALTMAEVLKGYTANAAWIANMEGKVGTLEPGKYADITVSSCDLFKASEDELRDAHAVCTVFNGKIVFDVS